MLMCIAWHCANSTRTKLVILHPLQCFSKLRDCCHSQLVFSDYLHDHNQRHFKVSPTICCAMGSFNTTVATIGEISKMAVRTYLGIPLLVYITVRHFAFQTNPTTFWSQYAPAQPSVQIKKSSWAKTMVIAPLVPIFLYQAVTKSVQWSCRPYFQSVDWLYQKADEMRSWLFVFTWGFK